MNPSASVHGGPDAQGAARWDFSTNANACGPAPTALRALQAADPTRYPDPACTALRESLGAWHGVAPQRVVIGASASELIVRITAAMARLDRGATVWAPCPGYADYAQAALACGLALGGSPSAASLRWQTAPGSPFGDAGDSDAGVENATSTRVVDRAYAPLRLEGAALAVPETAWQLWSPNKALGLAGVRGAYAIAPAAAGALRQAVDALAPSWPLGAHGVAMLAAWTDPETQDWLARSLDTLRAWKRQQLALCADLGWYVHASVTPFFVARWDVDAAPPPSKVLPRLRVHGVQLRDTASMGLPGSVRLSVQPPAAQQALLAAWQAAVRRREFHPERTR